MALPYETLVARITAGQRQPVYLLAGPDGLQRRCVISALSADVSDLGRQRLDGGLTTPGDVIGALRSVSFVPGRLVIVDDPPWVLAARGQGDDEEAGPAPGARGRAKAGPEQALLDYLERPAPDATLVLTTAQPADKRRRLTKRITERGVFLEANPPRENGPWIAAELARLGLSLEGPLIERLCARLHQATCERMASELAKVADYGPGLDAAALDALVPPGDTERVFDLVDAVVAGQVGPALDLAAGLLRLGEPGARLLYMLAGQLRAIIAVAAACQGGRRPDAVAGELGLHPFVARKALDQSRRFPPEAALAALIPVWEAELGFKTGGLQEEEALDHAVLGILAARGALGGRPAGGPAKGPGSGRAEWGRG